MRYSLHKKKYAEDKNKKIIVTTTTKRITPKRLGAATATSPWKGWRAVMAVIATSLIPKVSPPQLAVSP